MVREYIDMSSSVLSDTRGGPKSATGRKDHVQPVVCVYLLVHSSWLFLSCFSFFVLRHVHVLVSQQDVEYIAKYKFIMVWTILPCMKIHVAGLFSRLFLRALNVNDCGRCPKFLNPLYSICCLVTRGLQKHKGKACGDAWQPRCHQRCTAHRCW